MVMRLLVVIALLVATTQGKSTMDLGFCNAHTKQTSGQQEIDPFEAYDYSFNAEIFNMKDKVTYQSRYFSFDQQFIVTKSSAPHGEIEFDYVFPSIDTLEVRRKSTSKDVVKCTSEPLQGSDVAKQFQIIPDPKTGNLNIPLSDTLVPNTFHTMKSYIGQEVVRGIRADHWHICAHQDWSNKTVSAEIYFNSRDVIMPGSHKQVPIVMKTFEKNDNTNEVNQYRYDLSYFTSQINLNSKALKIPVSMYCENAVTANNDMPKMPDEFYFKVQVKDLNNTDHRNRATPNLRYMEPMYDGDYKIFTELKESVGVNEITKFRSRMVHDFNTGLQYEINLSTGVCHVSKINLTMNDFKTTYGFVQMRNPNELFEIDDQFNYQYMGKHTHFDRDIEADVYTAVRGNDDTKIILTWWFASKAFLKKIQHTGEPMPLRVKLETTNPNETSIMDFYQFTDSPRQDQIFPDLSVCMSPGKEIYITITLTARYDRIYSRNPEHFKDAFGTAMMKYSGIINPIRIAQLRVEPADKSNTLVQFTLLDKPAVTGNAMSMLPEKDNSAVWTALKKNLDSGKFTLTVHDGKGTHVSAKAIKYSKEFDNPRSFKVKQAQLSSASLFSPGAMAGLGIGMLLVGLILGFGSFKVTKRYRDRVPDIAMQSLGK